MILFERDLLSFENEVNLSKEGFLKIKFQRDLWCQNIFLNLRSCVAVSIFRWDYVVRERKERKIVNERVTERESLSACNGVLNVGNYLVVVNHFSMVLLLWVAST